ncbi:MAG TPA: MFS transporter [Pseudomonadota bacterium]|nr:MFS transporter [Pseudomonadota bacterium]
MTDMRMAAPWYRSLSRTQWNTLLASNLGWVFDGFEAYALILTVGVALRQLLDPSQHAQIPVYAGAIIVTTLCGWGIGGMTAGVLADYIGRKRTMILAILTYSIMTGLSAFAWDWVSFAVMRFLVGLAIGSEWVTGTSMTAELWPDNARGKGIGLFQCGFGIGFFIASLVWLFVGGTGPGAWRTMYLIGALPALLTLWIRRSIPESTLWEQANERRRAAPVGFIFNGPRFLAAIGTLLSGALIVKFGGYGNACMIVATIYILALIVVPFLPETRGKPLPQ